jgi:hypothetical protein
MVFAELQKFVSTNHGPQAWHDLLQKAGLGGKLYLPVTNIQTPKSSRWCRLPRK